MEQVSLKIKVNASTGCQQDSSSESGGSDEEREKCDTNGPKHWSIVHRDELNRQLASQVTCGTFSAFDLFGIGFAFAFAVFADCIALTS